MQIDLNSCDWTRLLAYLRERPDPENRDLDSILEREPITSISDSCMENLDFGEVFQRAEPLLSVGDARALGRFTASFCGLIGGSERFPTPRDADLGESECHSVMSPATLGELSVLPEQLDRRKLRQVVRQIVIAGETGMESVAAYFDYLDRWTRAYRLLTAEGRGGVVVVG